MRPARALAGRTLRDARVATVSFALLFFLVALSDVVGYRDSYRTLGERIAFARSFGTNKAVELFYGVPHDLLTVGGYTAWRLSGLGAVFAGAFGLLVAVRALRGEEDSGRRELVLACRISRAGALDAVAAALVTTIAALWLAIYVALLAAGLPAGGSAFLALATISPAPVFAAFGAVASQVAPTRRLATELASALLGLSLLVRVVADTAGGLGWMRWLTPLGWVEQLRPFAQPTAAPLLAPLGATVALLALTRWLAARRDLGSGLLADHDSTAPRLRLLSSPLAQAFRGERGSLAIWLLGTGLFALVVGLLTTSLTNADIPANLRADVRKLGGASITTPNGALGFYFIFFVLTISLFVCAQLSAARREEEAERLETLLSLPLSRQRWLGGRIVLAAAGALALACSAGLLAWAGAAGVGASVSGLRLLEAGLNCLPTALFFLGLCTLAFAVVPRATSFVGYALVTVAFLWDLLGALLGAPSWLVELTPFAHIGLVPAEPFRAGPAFLLVAVAACALAAATALFARRDVIGG